ncbi:hypothetical protein LMTR3_21630 [Bradyrhizobium sp. LMTR 3]|nr:hypothetical protein LMTR3_21630 [Bradyrhizobium sp. LMTR 3]
MLLLVDVLIFQSRAAKFSTVRGRRHCLSRTEAAASRGRPSLRLADRHGRAHLLILDSTFSSETFLTVLTWPAEWVRKLIRWQAKKPP